MRFGWFLVFYAAFVAALTAATVGVATSRKEGSLAARIFANLLTLALSPVVLAFLLALSPVALILVYRGFYEFCLEEQGRRKDRRPRKPSLTVVGGVHEKH